MWGGTRGTTVCSLRTGLNIRWWRPVESWRTGNDADTRFEVRCLDKRSLRPILGLWSLMWEEYKHAVGSVLFEDKFSSIYSVGQIMLMKDLGVWTWPLWSQIVQAWPPRHQTWYEADSRERVLPGMLGRGLFTALFLLMWGRHLVTDWFSRKVRPRKQKTEWWAVLYLEQEKYVSETTIFLSLQMAEMLEGGAGDNRASLRAWECQWWAFPLGVQEVGSFWKFWPISWWPFCSSAAVLDPMTPGNFPASQNLLGALLASGAVYPGWARPQD